MQQIRVLLIDSFVMTTLFYPALVLQLQGGTGTSIQEPSRPTNSSAFLLLTSPLKDSLWPYPELPFEFPSARYFWEDKAVHARDASLTNETLVGATWSQSRSEDQADIWRIDGNPSNSAQDRIANRRHSSLLVAASVVWNDVKGLLTQHGALNPSTNGQTGPSEQSIHTAPDPNSIFLDMTKLVQEFAYNIQFESKGSVECLRSNTVSKDKQHPADSCWIDSSETHFESLDSNRLHSAIAYFRIDTSALTFSRGKGLSIKEEIIRNLKIRWENFINDVVKNQLGGVVVSNKIVDYKSRRDRSLILRVSLTCCRFWHCSASLTHPPGQIQPSTAMLPSHTPLQRPNQNQLPTSIMLLYIPLITYFLILLSRATNVHSRFGLAFTGIVELGCSSLMSFSVMALLGFGTGGKGIYQGGEESVPVYLLPFVILIVGVENMSAMVKAVYSVPVSYSVPDRVALGLAKVGPGLLFTSMTDIAILTIIGFFVKLGPVRDFCLFASILIVVHFWMLITFFLTVLSIDCQRLELDDLLRQGSEIPLKKTKAKGKDFVPNDWTQRPDLQHHFGGDTGVVVSEAFAHSSWISGARRVWRARTARGGSLILILATLTGLYYVNESQGSANDKLAELGRRFHPSAGNRLGYDTPKTADDLLHPHSTTENDALSNALKIWQAIRPGLDDNIFVDVFAPIKVILPSPDSTLTPNQLAAALLPTPKRAWLPRLRTVLAFLKVIVLPTCGEASLLYLLLLYLLKDADLLDAQRDKKYAGEKRDDESGSTDEANSGHDHHGQTESSKSVRLARNAKNLVSLSCDTDVRQVAVAADKEIAIALTAAGQAVLFNPCGSTSTSLMTIPKTTLVESGATLVSISEDGTHVCVATQSGLLQFFDTSVPAAISISQISIRSLSVPPKSISLVQTVLPDVTSPCPKAFVALQDGSVHAVTLSDSTFTCVVPPTNEQPNSVSVEPITTDLGISRSLMVATIITPKTVVIWQEPGDSQSAQSWTELFRHHSPFSGSTISASTVAEYDGSLYVVAGNVRGFVFVWSVKEACHVWSGQLLPLDDDDDAPSPVVKVDCLFTQSDFCALCNKPKMLFCNIVGATINRVCQVQLQIQDVGSRACTCVSGSRLGDNLLAVSGKRTPRRSSRTMPPAVASPLHQATDRRTQSNSPPHELGHANGTADARSLESPPVSQLTDPFLVADHQELMQSSHEALERFAQEQQLGGKWTKLRSRHWAMHRGDFTILRDQHMLMITRKQPANAAECLDAQWQLVMVHLSSTEGVDWSLLPFEPRGSDLTPQSSRRGTSSTSSTAPQSQSFGAVRAQRLASLTQSNSSLSGPVLRKTPLLAFSQARMVDSRLGYTCLTITGNLVHTRRLAKVPTKRVRSRLNSSAGGVESSPSRTLAMTTTTTTNLTTMTPSTSAVSMAYHTAPLAPPTLTTPRR